MPNTHRRRFRYDVSNTQSVCSSRRRGEGEKQVRCPEASRPHSHPHSHSHDHMTTRPHIQWVVRKVVKKPSRPDEDQHFHLTWDVTSLSFDGQWPLATFFALHKASASSLPNLSQHCNIQLFSNPNGFHCIELCAVQFPVHLVPSELPNYPRIIL